MTLTIAAHRVLLLFTILVVASVASAASHMHCDAADRDRLTLDRLQDALGALNWDDFDDLVSDLPDEEALQREVERLQNRAARWFDKLSDVSIAPDHGTFLVNADGARIAIDAAEMPRELIVLVHGLDDPGWLWDDMIIALQQAGYTVALADYPHNSSISASADFLADEMAQLKQSGVDQIDFVAHSMGGLVCRDLLTRERPDHAAIPQVDRLIMIGTPNHGTHMARLRGVSKLGERMSRFWRGEGWRSSGGEAGAGRPEIDLLPGSDYLTELNSRPLPDDIDLTIIAGRASPVAEEKIDEMRQSVSEFAQGPDAPDWLRRLATDRGLNTVAGGLQAAVRGVGDGIVTIDSTRLDGVDDFVIVDGDHLTMLVNTISKRRQPPAIAEVLTRLGEGDSTAEASTDS